MIDFFLHPAVQAGVFPFLASLVIAIALMRAVPSHSDIAPVIAFLIAHIIIYGVGDAASPWALKIIITCMLAAVLGLLLDRVEMHPNYLRSILWFIGMAGALWVFGPELKKMDTSNIVLMGIMLTFYPAWMTWGLSEIRFRPVQVTIGLTLLGLGTGIAAVLGGAELAGQLAFAIGFAFGAALYLSVIAKWRFPSGLATTLPAGIAIGLLGVAALTYAMLSPISLVALAIIPLVLLILPEDALDNRGGLLLWGGLLLCVVGVGVFLAYVGGIGGYI
ncbi:MAG: hypothetical protein GY807_07810 [Gammaproteobacteria bacterium]|nr:hypothetical protein [Gammaproteobacteria bacterium]